MKRGILLVILALSGIAASRTLLVPEQYATVQSVLTCAKDGDTVLVRQPDVNHPQVHYKNIRFHGKRIMVIGRDFRSGDMFGPSFDEEKGDFSFQTNGIADCGDCNGDGRITGADATYLISYIYREGSPPLGQGDVNLDGRMTGADATYIINYIYRNGLPPCSGGWIGQGQVNEPDTLFDGSIGIAIDPKGKPWCVWMGKEARGSPMNIYSATWNDTAWEEELMVSCVDTFWDYAPSIAANDQGTILVAWMRETTYLIHDIYYAYWDGNGWVEGGTVNTPDTLNDGGPLMASGGGEIWIAWAGRTETHPGKTSIFASHWNGVAWGPEVEVIVLDSILPGGGFSLAVDHTGQPHLVLAGIYQGNEDIYYTTYDGDSWTKIAQINVPDGGEQDTDPSISVDSIGHLHVVWAANPFVGSYDYDIHYSKYDGTNWSEEVEISAADDLGDYRARVAARSADNIWVAWDGIDLTGEYHIYTVRFDGLGWSDEERLDTDDTDFDFDVGVVLNIRGSPWVVWSGILVGNPHFDIFYNRYSETEIEEPITTSGNIHLLFQVYPNPFETLTAFHFYLTTPAHVTNKIYDVQGRLIRIVVDEQKSPGHNVVLWDGTNGRGEQVPNGVYFSSLIIKYPSGPIRHLSETKSLILLRKGGGR